MARKVNKVEAAGTAVEAPAIEKPKLWVRSFCTNYNGQACKNWDGTSPMDAECPEGMDETNATECKFAVQLKSSK